MVRAGIVEHPEQWAQSDYREIQDPPRRYRVEKGCVPILPWINNDTSEQFCFGHEQAPAILVVGESTSVGVLVCERIRGVGRCSANIVSAEVRISVQ
jgi:hypothetical protein